MSSLQSFTKVRLRNFYCPHCGNYVDLNANVTILINESYVKVILHVLGNRERDNCYESNIYN